MFEVSTSDLIFRCLNFLVIMGLGGYLFYRYALQSIRRCLQQQRTERSQRIAQEHDAYAAVAHVEQETIKQDIIAHELTEKTIRWSHTIQAVEKQEQEDKRQIQERHRRMVQEQQEHRALEELDAAIRLTVIDDLEQRYSERYATDATNMAYIERVIQHLERDSHE